MEVVFLFVGIAVGVVATVIVCVLVNKSKRQQIVLEKENLNDQLAKEQQNSNSLSADLKKTTSDYNQLKTDKSAVDARLEVLGNQLSDEIANRKQLERERDEKISELTETIKNLNAEKEKFSNELEIEKKHNSEELEKREAKLVEQIKFAQEQLKNTTQEILKERQEQLQDTNKAQLDTILAPLSKNLDEFKKRVNEIHEKNIEDRTSMAKELEGLRKMNESIGKEAMDLTNALKGESKTQGNWGEMILEKQLELMGFVEGKHYERQTFLKDDNGFDIKGEDGKKLQPDILIKYPNNTEVIVDSKVSLTNYVNYVGAETEAERNSFLKMHLDSVKKHIDELSKKQYGQLNQGRSPEFVMMFIPNESAYIAAIKADANLWNYAYERKIVLLGPSTIMSALNLALDLWKREDQSANVKKIIEEANKLYDKVSGFCETFKKVGDNLKTLQGNYDTALSQLSDGKGNVVKRLETMRGLGLSPSKRIAIASADSEQDENENNE